MATLMWAIPAGPGQRSRVSHSESDLTKKANLILSGYGGLEGLARMPAWIVGEVLSAFFTKEEGREIVKLRLFKGEQKEILRRLQSKAAG